MIYTVALNPAWDKTVCISGFRVDAVNQVTAMRCDPAGKCLNVSKTAVRLGCPTTAFVVVAGKTGDCIVEALRATDITTRLYRVAGETRTNVKVVDSMSHTVTDINEPGVPVPQEMITKILDDLVQVISSGDVVVVGGSLPLQAPCDTYATWIRVCTAAGAKVFFDAAGAALACGLVAQPFFVKPNRCELEELVGHKLEDENDLLLAARNLHESGVTKVVISLGADGALYMDDNYVLRAEAPAVTVRSTVGAGDSVVAAFACAEEMGMGTKEAFRLAVATGSAHASCEGTQAASKAMIDALVDQVTVRELS